jgi:dipeptidyl aminopeptidase/acylaminoacyl peptidase
VTRTIAPYGTWTSPITTDLLVEKAVSLGQVEVRDGRVTWNELRPNDGARQVIVAGGSGADEDVDLLPAGFSARTQVHEYGGRCYTFAPDGALIASNWEDQRLWCFAPGAEPEALTPDPPSARADRYADPFVTPDGRWVICVRERHRPGPDAATTRVDNAVVAVPLPGGGEPVVLAEGHDFYSAPAVSPDGTRLAWLSWDHPDMPWDHTELWVAELADGTVTAPVLVAGDPGESVLQPRWSPAGVLHWVSDRTGWWNLYAAGEALCPMDAEFSEPGWVFGVSTYAFGADGRIVATWSGPDGSGIGVVAGGGVQPLDTPYAAFTSLRAAGTAAVCIAASPTEAPAVVRIDTDTSEVQVLRRSREVTVDPGFLSRPERVRFPTGDGSEYAYALFYPPVSADHEAPEGEEPPLVVMSHGGPTSSASSALNLGVQYWTSRGFAVADVDYRGSDGYGRAYRNRLRDAWGICDVEDCAGVVAWLASEGRVDPARAVIRGGSAGGFTTLAALAFTDAFAAGASHFGVADLEALARDTHKFESRYLDRLVGPWPEAQETYRARSPIHHVDGFDCPLILFQGLEDAVVPPAQSEMIHEAVRARGIPVAYLSFEGEQHGFRRASTIRAVAAAELSFYGRVFGFEPDGRVDVPIDNAAALPGA